MVGFSADALMASNPRRVGRGCRGSERPDWWCGGQTSASWVQGWR